MSITQAQTTPMMEQYFTIKKAHPDSLLFYRMGDFYEMFFEDAITASEVLNIALTKRGRYNGKEIPMCGVPVHNYTFYLHQLVNQGYKVALCEQVEAVDQARKRRGAKALVERAVVRIFTQGTLTEEELLDARTNNYLVTLVQYQKNFALSWTDLSTGELTTQCITEEDISSALTRLDSREIIVSESLMNHPQVGALCREWYKQLTIQPDSTFDFKNAQARLEAVYQVKTLEGFGSFTEAEVTAAGVLVDYVARTQKRTSPYFRPLRRIAQGTILEIDSATQRNLEILYNLSGSRVRTLLSTIDQTITNIGARLLCTRLASPLTDISAITRRLDGVTFWIQNMGLCYDIRQLLRGVPDMERAFRRLSLDHGGPRDLAAIRDALEKALKTRNILLKHHDSLPEDIACCVRDMACDTDLLKTLTERLAPSPLPVYARDGNFIAPGISSKLDEQLTLRDKSRQLLSTLQIKYVKQFRISSLKIKHNTVLGYYIEIPITQSDRLISKDQENLLKHRQTTANTVRFKSDELSTLEQNISQAVEKVRALELMLFIELVSMVMHQAKTLISIVQSLAKLDVSCALAVVAETRNWCRPRIDKSLSFDIRQGRHLVVEAAQQQELFVANNCDLSPGNNLWLLTGANMTGKSTFLRQNALILILAQIGAYVPAQSAHIGIVDRLFSRVGAGDDLARGRSTFMVEMTETAAILHQATSRSFILLDEIGRGTSTYDGLSIACACIEYLHDVIQCRCLFATHFHELTRLAQKLPSPGLLYYTCPRMG